MKIKRVKITGFRAFEKEEDSTFDFTKNGEIMNFASIYAPNGYGKTAFYDAIEFCITNRIQRFDRMVDFKNLKRDNQASIILNHNSRSGKINVDTNSISYPRLVKKAYASSAMLENKHFQSQFLSQDLIDAFLKEEKAEDRYTKFLEIDYTLKQYDAAYKKINTLLGYIKDEKIVLDKNKKNEEANIPTEIDFDQEFKKFHELNRIISELIEENESLDLIDQSTFNQTVHGNFSRNIDVRLLSLQDQLIKTRLRADKIVLARDGKVSRDGKLDGGVVSYLSNRGKILILEEQNKKLEQIVKLFEEQEQTYNELIVSDEYLESQQKKLDRALNFEKRFETFLNIQEELDRLQNEIADLKTSILYNERGKIDAEADKQDQLTKINRLKNILESTQFKLNTLPAQQTQLRLVSKVIVDSQSAIVDLSKLLNKEEEEQDTLKLILDEFDYYESKFNVSAQSLLDFKLLDNYAHIITRVIVDEENLQKLIKDVQQLDVKISNHINFESELNQFIKSGLELASRSQSTHCPLCDKDYGTFEALSKCILSNEILSSQLKGYLEEKKETEEKVNTMRLQLSAGKEGIKNALLMTRAPFLSRYQNILNVIDKLKSERDSTQLKLNDSQIILNEIMLSLGDSQNFEDLSAKIQDDISKIHIQIVECSNQIKKNESIISEKQTHIQTAKERLSISETNFSKHHASSDFNEVREYFINELKATAKISVLSEHISRIQHTIDKLSKKKEGLSKTSEDLKLKLSSYPLAKDDYIQQSQKVNTDKDLALRIHESYENYVLSEFKIDISNKDKPQIEKAFINLIGSEKQLEQQAEIKIEKYTIARFLNNACIQATESKVVQERIEAINSSVKKLTKAESELIIEKESLKLYLKNTIEAYFYTPLINAIYSKIDPHPDYKKIEFECDFSENKPRLQIYTTLSVRNGAAIKSIPSLYFSTAQINILSLSIFLARALKTKDDKGQSVDCIFIDDPIQSMDSINILSFIDLFRGLTLSLDKQLIVSTHEENFHLLLQKKIPCGLFKSTFMEFETFGKLRTR